MVRHTQGWRRFFTLTYWRLQLAFILSGKRPLNIVSVFTLTMPDGDEVITAEIVDKGQCP